MDCNGLEYDILQEPLVIHKATMDLLLQDESPYEVIALYLFYYNTAKWQKTNNIKATASFCSNAIGFSVNRIRKIRGRLMKIGLIEPIIKKDPVTKLVTGHYINVKFVSFKIHPTDFPHGGNIHRVENLSTNALSNNSINALNNNNINALNKESNKETQTKVCSLQLFDVDMPNSIKKVSKKKTVKEFIIPEIEEVVKYFTENKQTVELAKKFFNYYNPEWIDSNDKKVKNWKLKAKNWFVEQQDSKHNRDINQTDNSKHRIRYEDMEESL